MPQHHLPPWLAVRVVCLGFVFGVLLHNARPLEPVPWWIPFILCIIGGLLSFLASHFSHLASRVSRLASLISLVLFACALGLLRFDLTLPTANDALSACLGEEVEMRVEIEDLGKFDAILGILEINGMPARSRSKLSVTSAGKGMKVGETWKVSCRIEKNEKTEMKQILYDARKGVFFRCRGTISAKLIKDASPWNIETILSKWRSVMTSRIGRLIPGDEGALLAGILYGERGLSSEENAAFRMAGMTHLIAVSGSNISIVIGLFVPIFLALGYRRRSSIVFSGFGVILFSIFVGAGASVLRAALMGWIAILARAFGRRADAFHLLLLVGTIMILFDPWALGYDAGFALSFLATWGLLVPGQVISKRLTWIPEVGGIREAFSTTLAASLATAPYSLWAFGSVSLLGLITNLVAIPLTAFTMAWGAIACVVGDWVPYLVSPAKGMLSAMLLIANIAERFPMFVITYDLPLWFFGLVMISVIGYFQCKSSLQKERIELTKEREMMGER
jgi:ComEC/Rec2-related protein